MPEKKDFQAFTIKFDGRSPRIITDVVVMPAFDPKKGHPDGLQTAQTSGLWDTGATRSVIAHEVAQALNLIPTGTTQVQHAGGMGSSPTYVVNFRLPNAVGVAGAQVTELPKGAMAGGGFGAIIGMDIIGLGDLSITNVNQKTCMSFRMPSIKAIDYVVQAKRVRFSGVGRNDPCPCGSGKKFKKCCWPVS